jgi:hypothetical protein
VRTTAIGAVLVVCGCAGATAPTASEPAARGPRPSAAASADATASTIAAPGSIEAAGATHIDLTGQPDWVALAAGSAWVAVVGGVRKVDGATGKVDGLVPIDDVVCLAMDVGFDTSGRAAATSTS